MNRPVKLWEAVLGIIGVLLSVAVMIYNRGKIDATNASQIQTLQDQLKVYQQTQERMDEKIDHMNENITNILIKLEDKQNRKQ